MRKHLVNGYLIVHGQSIHVFANEVIAPSMPQAAIIGKNKLKVIFENVGDIVELPNCIFEKSACAGFYVDVKDIGHVDNVFKRIWNKRPRLIWR